MYDIHDGANTGHKLKFPQIFLFKKILILFNFDEDSVRESNDTGSNS